METQITFQGKQYLLVGDLVHGGPIATQEQYENGQCPYAHLYEDGVIRRLGQSIGNRTDIDIVGETETDLGPNFLRGLLDAAWFQQNKEDVMPKRNKEGPPKKATGPQDGRGGGKGNRTGGPGAGKRTGGKKGKCK